jgi:hypothetical protein
MKAKTMNLVVGMALTANVGFAQAAELDETAGMPDILGAVATHEAIPMIDGELEAVQGELWWPKRYVPCNSWNNCSTAKKVGLWLSPFHTTSGPRQGNTNTY